MLVIESFNQAVAQFANAEYSRNFQLHSQNGTFGKLGLDRIVLAGYMQNAIFFNIFKSEFIHDFMHIFNDELVYLFIFIRILISYTIQRLLKWSCNNLLSL